MKLRKRRTNKEYIHECKIIHNNYYDYIDTQYIKMHNKIIVKCPKHGNFKLEANHHIRGVGCAKCAFEKNHNLLKDNNQSFIEKSKKIHKDKYLYNKCKYGRNAHEKVILICKKHGEFLTSPNGHLSSKIGCPKCGKEKCGWNKTTWRKACENKIAKLYIVKCFNENETFYKIGITCNNIHIRLGCKSQLPYDYETIKLIESDNSDYIFDLERKLHKFNKQFKYKPLINFDGNTECFSQYKTMK